MEVANHPLTAKEVAAMFSRHAASIRDQLRTLRRQFLQDGDLPFTNILTEQLIAQALATITGWLDRIFPPWLRSGSSWARCSAPTRRVAPRSPA